MNSNVFLSVLGDPQDAALAAQIKHAVEKAGRILVTGHERPDGDCIGSVSALCSILRALGKSAAGVLADAVPVKYDYLNTDGALRQAAPGEIFEADLVFVLDSTDLSRIRIQPSQFGEAQLIDIDHHQANPNFGTINWVDTRAAATAELIWRLAANNAWQAPKLALDALYTGLVTDTGQFAYSNTTPRVLRMAAEAVEHGVDPESIWQRIYLNKTESELALDARARASLQCIAGGRICSIALRYSDFVETGTGPQNTEDMAQIARSIKGVQLSAFFYEIDEGRKTKCSLRASRGVDVRVLAQTFGGGGHTQASGCTINLPLAEAKKLFLERAEAYLQS